MTPHYKRGGSCGPGRHCYIRRKSYRKCSRCGAVNASRALTDRRKRVLSAHPFAYGGHCRECANIAQRAYRKRGGAVPTTCGA